MSLREFSPPRYVATIAERLAQLGGQPHYVGGAVRDAIIGRKPHDYDLASSLSPDDVQRAFNNVVLTGAKHGTVTVVTDDGNAEVTTFRSDGSYADGRHPNSVTFVPSIQLDLARRDFTMNAVAIDAMTGAIVDPHGGMQDALDCIVRTVGEPRLRFAEDGLRVMRAVRFAAQLGFNIDASTLAAIGPKPLTGVSAERIRDELLKVLSSADPASGIALLCTTGIMKYLIGDSLTLSFVSAAPSLASIDIPMRLAAAACRGSAGSDVGVELKRLLKVDSRDAQLCSNAARAIVMLREDHGLRGVRAALSSLGRDAVVIAALLEHDSITVSASRAEPIIIARSLPFNGDDIMRMTGVTGSAVGAVIRKAVNAAICEPCLLADSDRLLALAQV